MINTRLTRKAMNIAYNAHMNQFDKAGVPYIYHPIHLAEQMDSETECIVALLHDVVEDTEVTLQQLEKEFSREITESIRLLTHSKDDDYSQYINELSKNYVAKKVKIADLLHNMDETRLENITEQDIIRREKYKTALEFLQGVKK